VYFEGRVVYVGSSTDLSKRVRQYFRVNRGIRSYDDDGVAPHFETPWGHVHDGTLVRVKVKPSRQNGDWLMREWRLIGRLRPIFNSAGIKQ
jgi:hypothetical protein